MHALEGKPVEVALTVAAVPANKTWSLKDAGCTNGWRMEAPPHACQIIF
ncbi:MAG TPA: hypothetical protein VMW07_04975 [Gallionella sp.]|nr:hypothetical protein [Gallionella sp.]